MGIVNKKLREAPLGHWCFKVLKRYNKAVDNQSNRKKRRARGDGVTSYRVTSSLSLSDTAYEHQQRAAQQPQPDASSSYAQAGYETPQDYDYGQYDAQQGYDGQQGYAQQPYDPNAPQPDYTAQENYDYSAQGYDTSQGYDAHADAQHPEAQAGYDYSQPGYEQPGYEQPGHAQPDYDNQQQDYDYSQQGYDAHAGTQGYDGQNYDYSQQGYDYNQPGYDQQQPYDANADQQGYYDNEGNYHYYQGDQGYGDQGYYDQEPAAQEIPKRKRKIETVRDYYAEIIGEGQVFATDSEESPYEPAPSQQRSQYLNPAHLPSGAQPARMYGAQMGAQSPLIQMLGPVAGVYDLFLKLKSKWKLLTEKITYYTDVVLDLQNSVQKEMKEAATLAYKGFMNQLKQRSPLAVPYQHGPGEPGAAPGGYPNDPQYAPPPEAPRYAPVSFADLQELNVEFTDNYDQPLFDFAKYANSQYKVSKMIVDPAAMEAALWAIRECATRAGAIPPAQEGPYANIPLNEVMDNIVEEDLMAFLNYVKAFPGNYVSRNLKISETFATWVVYGAPTP